MPSQNECSLLQFGSQSRPNIWTRRRLNFEYLLNRGELAQPSRSLFAVECRLAIARQIQCALVVITGGTILPDLIQAHREIKCVIRILGLSGMRLEVRGLGFGPTGLRGVLIAQGEMQCRRIRLLIQKVLQATFRLHRIDKPAQTGERGLRVGIARLLFEDALITRFGIFEVLRAHVDGREPQLCVPVKGVVLDSE